MWIRLKAIQNIDRNGKNYVYHPGDWVDVGKQTALLWMARGDAEIPSYKRDTIITGEIGVVINAETITPFEPQFGLTKLKLLMVTGSPHIAFNKTMCWNPNAHLRPELVGAGFSFLDTWEIAMPIWSYDELAVHIGSNEDQEKTKKVIRDLRVPVYDTRLIFVRHCENTVNLFEKWLNALDDGGDERLAFMRAYYEVKPLMLALPITWHTERAYADAV